MKSYSAYFVRADHADKAQAAFRNVVPIEGSDWLMCGFRKDDSPPDDEVLQGPESLTQGKSQELGEIFFVYGDMSINGFVYEHARDGELLRKLVWFPMLDDDWTEGWLCAEGEPEAWEADLFNPSFNPSKMAEFIKDERQRFEDEGMEDDFPRREAEIREIWESGRIVAGQTFPSCDGTVALLVEQSYGISRPL